MKSKISISLEEFRKVNPELMMIDIKEDTEGEYDDIRFVGLKVETEHEI